MMAGRAIGIRWRQKVEMTGSRSWWLHPGHSLRDSSAARGQQLCSMKPVSEQILFSVHLTEVFLRGFIGAVTFTGSVGGVWVNCAAKFSRPLMLPNRQQLNLAAKVVSFHS